MEQAQIFPRALALPANNRYTGTVNANTTLCQRTMTLFLRFTLLFLLALPAFAQDDSLPLGQELPRDPALLMRMREQLTFELRETQRTLGFINPNDTQLIETLRARQAELARQMSNVSKQLQSLGNPIPEEMFQTTETRPGALLPIQPTMQSGVTPAQSELPIVQGRQEQPSIRQTMGPPGMYPTPSMMGQSLPPSYSMPVMPMPGGSYYSPTHNMPPDMMDIPQHWNNQTQATDAPYWGPKLPKELSDVKQSVEALQKEVVELKELVGRLETQIQLLNRTVLLLSSERLSERVPAPERMREIIEE